MTEPLWVRPALCGLLWLGVGGQSQAWAQQSAVLDARIRDAIEHTRHMKVVYRDPLGEGSGVDPDPRLPSSEVDCMTWVQLVLARALDGSVSLETRLDRVRYFGGAVDFRTRKHYLDRWLQWEPSPLSAVDLSGHPQSVSHVVELEPVLLRAARGASCSLWRENERRFETRFLPADVVLEDVDSWESGWYVLTGIATDKYLQLYGQEVGPMGQVHLFLLDATAAGRQGKKPEAYDLWHASIRRGEVVQDSLGRLLGNTRTIYQGFVPYRVTDELAPAKSPELAPCEPAPPDAQEQRAQ